MSFDSPKMVVYLKIFPRTAKCEIDVNAESSSQAALTLRTIIKDYWPMTMVNTFLCRHFRRTVG